jgi:hypothetical protein
MGRGGDWERGRILKKDEHPPAMHRAMDWCKHGHTNKMVVLDSHQIQGIAGRSNVQHRILNEKKLVMESGSKN